MPERDGAARWRSAASLAVWLVAAPAYPQSAADLSARLIIDGDLSDFNAAEAVFRTPDVCAALVPPLVCSTSEERPDDSSGGAPRDVRQLFATWDARALYLGVDATLDGMALVTLVDLQPGGLADLTALPEWRRAVRCATVSQPDFLLVCDDTRRIVELWRVVGAAGIERVDDAAFVAAVRFGAAGQGLEAAIPWSVLFPDAQTASDPEPGAPLTPVFVLPQASSTAGLRLSGLVVESHDGFGALDVAPDPRAGVSIDPRNAVDVDRVARVAWDENRAAGQPAFVDFGAAVQTQVAARILPEPPAAPLPLVLSNLQTNDAGRPTPLLIADAGRVLSFTFDVGSPPPPEIFLTARVLSLRGELVRELYQERRRTAPFTNAAQDVWDGRDTRGASAPGGAYVLQLRATLAPGGGATILQHAIAVVR